MTHLIMGLGIPGSGKTTILRPFAAWNGYTYLSADDIRAELLGGAEDQSQQHMIWREVYRRVTTALARGENVVMDATWSKVDERRRFIRFARDVGAERVYGVFVRVPLEVAKERNKMRHRVVPDRALERMDRRLKESPPSLQDGFDKVWCMETSSAKTSNERKSVSRVFL